MSELKPVVVIAGVGSGTGTGAASAHLFAKRGYSIALIARHAESLRKFSSELAAQGYEASAFPIPSYTAKCIEDAFSSIRQVYPLSTYSIRVAIWNVGDRIVKPFLSFSSSIVSQSSSIVFESCFAFSQKAITEFQKNLIYESAQFGGAGKRGTLIFTGATSSIRGNVGTSLFAAGKHATRGLSQSLSKEFGKENVHVAHVIIDGTIPTKAVQKAFGDKIPGLLENKDIRLEPGSIATAFLYLVNQDRSAWTWELDLRPAHEKW